MPIIDLGDGTTVIVCTSRQRVARCQVCKKRPHTKLCDWKIDNENTCDKKLCDGCAVKIDKGTDYCPEHK